MKKTIGILLALFLVAIVPAMAGQTMSQPMSTPGGEYKANLYGYQTLTAVWEPCAFNPAVSCRVTKNIDTVSVSTDSQGVQPSTGYTLVVNTNKATPRVVTCLVSKTSSSISVRTTVAPYWVKKGFLSIIKTPYAWSGLIDNGNDEKFMLVKSADVNCAKGKITNYQPSTILSTAAI